MQTVGIIGGSGFIGSHITKLFLEEGANVKASTTTIDNKSKYQHLLSFKNSKHLTIFPLDVRDKNGLKTFVEGCDILVHAGTPFQLDVKDPESELINPAVEGTRNLLEAIHKAEHLKKVIIIASVAAWNTSFPFVPEIHPADHIFSETDTPYMKEDDHPYGISKYLADQEVRSFIQNHPDLTFEITSLSPTWVVGNPLSPRQDSTSIGMQLLIKNAMAVNPFMEAIIAQDILFSMVDVRDVAEAVFLCTLKNGIHGRNYLIANESYRVSDISRMLNRLQPLNEPLNLYSNSLAKKELGISFFPIKETLHQCT